MRLYKKVLKENVNLFADPEYLKFTNITHALNKVIETLRIITDQKGSCTNNF